LMGTGYHTSFFIILHINKGGSFKGVNDWKHQTTAFVNADIDDAGGHYLWHEKNRRGKIFKKMYYSLNEKGGIYFDLDRWNKDKEMDKQQVDELVRLKEEGNLFSKMINDNAKTRKGGEEKTAE